MMIENKYKEFIMKKNGTKAYPWNIYYNGTRVGLGETLVGCKIQIDEKFYDEDVKTIDKYGCL